VRAIAIQGGDETELIRAESRTGFERDGALRQILARAPHVIADGGPCGEGRDATGDGDVLLHDDRVGTFGQRGTRENSAHRAG